jgi:sterol desaturase/sphingolipid hydroxylase (fatty acid hydroxylase superfamily)
MGPAHDNPWLALLVQQESLVLLLATFGGMLVFMLFEGPRPGREQAPLPVAHWLSNWFLAAINYFAGLWLVLQLGSLPWARALQPERGIFELLHPALALAVLVLLVEGLAYLMHRLYHGVPLLWRVHAVHHMDCELDVTTSHRHHVLEVVTNTLVMLPFFLLLGAPAVVLVLLSLLRTFVVLLNHSTLSLPPALDRVLGWLIVTPAFHHVHHLSERENTNANYGTVVPWFDYLFGTARRLSREDLAAGQIGLEYLREPRDGRLDRVLLLPFTWRRAVAGSAEQSGAPPRQAAPQSSRST